MAEQGQDGDGVGQEPLFELSGGALCLDFANTVGDRPRYQEERLRSYGDLVAWGRQAGVLAPGQADRLDRLAARHPGAAAAFARAVELRECLARLFSAVAAGSAPPADDLAALNAALAEALVALRVVAGGDGFGWAWAGDEEALERMLWPVVRSAAELLTSEECRWVRQCAGTGCSWLFVDRSRTRRRRWCDMKTCGNRSKARRHYQRKRSQPPAGGQEPVGPVS